MNGKDEPVVSIIMPVRDAAATLEDAIDSILHQDYVPVTLRTAQLLSFPVRYGATARPRQG